MMTEKTDFSDSEDEDSEEHREAMKKKEEEAVEKELVDLLAQGGGGGGALAGISEGVKMRHGLGDDELSTLSPRDVRKRIKKARKEQKRLDEEKERREQDRDARFELKLQRMEEQELVRATLGTEQGVSADSAESDALVAAERVHVLSATKVVASSGPPKRDREIRVYATLEPRAYTILVAPAQRGMEGPFTLTMHSSQSVKLSALWPPSQDVVHNGPAAFESSNPFVQVRRMVGGVVSSIGSVFAGEDHTSMLLKLSEEKEAADAVLAMEEATEAMQEEVEEMARKEKEERKDDKMKKWEIVHDPIEGKDYYLDLETGKSQWDKPIDLAREERLQEQLKAESDARIAAIENRESKKGGGGKGSGGGGAAAASGGR